MKYSIGRIHPTPQGTFRVRLTISGVRHDKILKTLPDAKNYIDSLVVNAYRTPKTLAPDQYHDALRAVAELPDGATLLDAVRQYNANQPRPTPQITTKDAIDKFIQEKTDAGRREKTTESLRSLLNKLDPDTPLADWTPDLITNVVSPFTPVTRNNHLRAFGNLFRWARARGYLRDVPSDPVTRAVEDETTPGILTVEQTRALLRAAAQNDPPLVPVIAIAAFAGIRTVELRRLLTTAVDLKGGHIHISGAVAKTRATRYVDIHPTLRAWLKAYPLTPGTLIPPNYRKRISKIRTAAKINPWPENAHRHSYASYHLAAFQDPGKTAHQLGHPNSDLLYQRYRKLVTKKQGLQYFNIRPT